MKLRIPNELMNMKLKPNELKVFVCLMRCQSEKRVACCPCEAMGLRSSNCVYKRSKAIMLKSLINKNIAGCPL